MGELGNVVCMTFAAPEEENAFFLAHLDTVFPEETPLIIRVDGSRRSCPGIGGQHGQRGPADAGDETHGRAQRLGRDLYRDEVNTSCIGSLRHRIAVEVQGVYFFHDLGRPKAVAVLASAIDRLYRFAPSGTHMTYNVDTLQGGTSVNVITQKASALFEHRSEGVRALRECDKFLKGMLEGFMWPDVRVWLETVREGISTRRPSGRAPPYAVRPSRRRPGSRPPGAAPPRTATSPCRSGFPRCAAAFAEAAARTRCRSGSTLRVCPPGRARPCRSWKGGHSDAKGEMHHLPPSCETRRRSRRFGTSSRRATTTLCPLL